jgi:hypothetical protein
LEPQDANLLGHSIASKDFLSEISAQGHSLWKRYTVVCLDFGKGIYYFKRQKRDAQGSTEEPV